MFAAVDTADSYYESRPPVERIDKAGEPHVRPATCPPMERSDRPATADKAPGRANSRCPGPTT